MAHPDGPFMRAFSARPRSLGLLAAALLATAGSADARNGPTPQRPAGLSRALTAKIDRLGRGWISEGHAVGIAIEILHGGKVVYARGYGVTAPQGGEQVTPRTVFRVGSLTKQFTAAAVLRLAQEGRLSIDDRLSKYFPTFPRGDEVTLRELLNQTSGLHNYTEVTPDAEIIRVFGTDHSTTDWVEHIAGQKPLYDFQPGSGWHYSNSGYFMLGAVVEKVAGESLGAYLEHSFFQPLGLHRTAIDGDIIEGAGRAKGFEREDGPGRRFEPAPYISMTVPGGAGALASSAEDLGRWSLALHGGRVLGKAGLAEMTTPGRLNDGRLSSQNRIATPASEPHTEYGMGLRIDRLDGLREIGHEGDIFGFNAAVDTYPERSTTIVVLANTPGGACSLEKRIARLMLRLPPRKRGPIQGPPECRQGAGA